MTNHSALSEGGNVVRYRLEAGEVDWEIAPGRKVRGYGFNGQVPGPILEAKQGVPLEIEFTNRLPEPTVIHWHGLRIPAAMDGTEVVQRPVQPGETFTYRFTPPDAGTFWYHPHANETEQLEKGLYGALIVRAADELALASAEAIRWLEWGMRSYQNFALGLALLLFAAAVVRTAWVPRPIAYLMGLSGLTYLV